VGLRGRGLSPWGESAGWRALPSTRQHLITVNSKRSVA